MTIIFCIPGNNFSGKFLECWTEVVANCFKAGIQPILSCRKSCNIYYVRNMCLGADVRRGKNQKPFNGQIDYDYIMWIDSDIIFNFAQFNRLLSHKLDIVSGTYLMEDGKFLATVKDWDEQFFTEHGCFNFLTVEDLKEDLFEVAYTGMGFILVKRGVFESMEYPWFKPIEKHIGDMVDFTMEDVAFCLRAKEVGFKVMIDPKVKVGHEKRVIF